MKTTYIIFVVTIGLIVSCSSDDQNLDPGTNLYIDIPDAQFETNLINLGIDSDNEINQRLLRVDAEKVLTLDLNSPNANNEISDLSGIEGFLNLKHLVATQHSIEEIDLSLNTKLETLYLGGNFLTTIDVSNNSNLVLIDLQSNDLTSINGLSGATNLKDLDLSWNYLEEFSIHNESLEVLHLTNNELTSININGAINLKHILLTTNQLASIDLRTNTSLETLVIPDNIIQNINLEFNSRITHLSLFSNLLGHLDVSNNQELVHMQVDRNLDLTCIKIHSNQVIPFVASSDYQELKTDCN